MSTAATSPDRFLTVCPFSYPYADATQCECFDGYEGKGCGRMSCPNDCSGNGRCMYADELPFGVNVGSFYHSQDNSSDYLGELGQTNGNDAVTFDYHGWDAGKTRMCKCNSGYEGVDCSYRSCPEGNDVMVERLNRVAAVKYQKQVCTLCDCVCVSACVCV